MDRIAMPRPGRWWSGPRWIARRMRAVARFWRKRRLVLQAAFHGGVVEMAPTVELRHPVEFRGRGMVQLGEGVVLGYELSGSLREPIMLQPREPGSLIRIGQGTMVANGCELIACKAIEIGSGCRIGPRCVIYDSDFHGRPATRRDEPGLTAPVKIGDRAWLGAEVMVLKGAVIGCEAVAGARCLVNRGVPDGHLAVGNPMRIMDPATRGGSRKREGGA